MIYLLLIFQINLLHDQPKLIIEVSQIKKVEGNIMLAVAISESTFLTEEMFSSGKFVVTGEEMVCPMELPFGSYAISVYHDVNGNGKLDTNVFGVPNEPVGFSNNAKGSFGPPGFGEVLFNFERDNQSIKISMN